MLTSACELEEVAPFLDKTVYENPQTAQASAKGIYAGLTSYNAKERGIFVINGFSGLFITGKNGQRISIQIMLIYFLLTQIMMLIPKLCGADIIPLYQDVMALYNTPQLVRILFLIMLQVMHTF